MLGHLDPFWRGVTRGAEKPFPEEALHPSPHGLDSPGTWGRGPGAKEESKLPRLRPKHDQTETPAASEMVKLIRRTRQAAIGRHSAEDKIRIVPEGKARLRGDETRGATRAEVELPRRA